jgi:hypothetical protein
VERRLAPDERAAAESESGPGVLFSSGLIAGGAITGILLAALQAQHLSERIDLSRSLGTFAQSRVVAMLLYTAFLAVPLYWVARRGLRGR